MKKYLPLLILPVIILSGCMTQVSVTTDPPGATIYSRGSGRNSYRYQYMGSTKDGQPVVFKVPYSAIKTFAVWPAANGQPSVTSKEIYTKLFAKGSPEIHIVK